MRGTKEEILGRITRALDGAERTPAPAYQYGTTSSLPDVAALFAERVEDYRAVVERVDRDGIGAAVAGALSGTRRIVVPPGLPPSWVAALDGIDVVTDDGTLSAAELNRFGAVITAAAVGIAETGTIVLDHGAGQGRRALSLVPDLHVCIVEESQLVGDVPESIGRLREAVRDGRPLTWISGPSATSDIELERVEGVHGPRTLHVLLVSAES
ncbi:MAG: LutC/YkgG family protein [Nocardioidaceae bacterium]